MAKKNSNLFYGVDTTKIIKKPCILGNGMYRIELEDDKAVELSLDEGEASELIELYNRHQNTGDASQNTSEDRTNTTPSAEEIDDLRFSRTPLERNLGSSMSDIEFQHPTLTLVGYAATPEDVQRFLSFGYTYAFPRDIKHYDQIFAENNPGQGLSPDGHIMINGHVLLVATEEVAKRKHDFYYKKREVNLSKAKEALKLGKELNFK